MQFLLLARNKGDEIVRLSPVKKPPSWAASFKKAACEGHTRNDRAMSSLNQECSRSSHGSHRGVGSPNSWRAHLAREKVKMLCSLFPIPLCFEQKTVQKRPQGSQGGRGGKKKKFNMTVNFNSSLYQPLFVKYREHHILLSARMKHNEAT